MVRAFNSLVVSTAALLAGLSPALAQEATVSHWWWQHPRPVTQVPEIDASTGALAIAAVLAVLAFVVERRRRRA